MNSRPGSRTNSPGFTLIEILIVIVLSATIVGLTLPTALRFYQNYVVEDTADNLKSALRRAHAYAASEREGSGHGVKILPGQFVLFQGMTYATRVTSEDQVVDFPTSLSVTGTSDEIRFSPLYATSSVSGTIQIVGDAGQQKIISINSAGKVESE